MRNRPLAPWTAAFAAACYASAAAAQLPAGGLRYPQRPASNDGRTVRQLQRAERRDSGRGLSLYWVDASGGVERLWLHALAGRRLVDGGAIGANQTAVRADLGAGVKLLVLTVGPRFTISRTPSFSLYNAALEAGLSFPLGRLEPLMFLSGGYSWLRAEQSTALSERGARARDVAANGASLELGGGVDWYPASLLSLGVRARARLMWMRRSGSGEGTYGTDESALGAGASATAVVGLHF